MPLLPKFLRSTLTRMQTAVGGDKPANAEANPEAAGPAEPQQDDSARFAQASAFHQRGQLDEAEALFRALLEKYPKDFDLLHRLGMIQGQRNNFEAAMGFIEQALAVEPNHASAHNILGNCLKGLGRHETALASYDRALALQPNDADTLNNRGATLRDLKRSEEALASFERALAINSGHVQALDNQAMSFRDLRRFDEARASYERALALYPENVEAHFALGNVLETLGRNEEALASYERAIALRTDLVVLHWHRGLVLNKIGRREAAVAGYDSVLKLQPDHLGALINKGIALRELGRTSDALACTTAALNLAPRDAIAHYNQAVSLYTLGQHEEALGSCETAISLEPAFAEAHQQRGNVLHSLGRHSEALGSYDRAIEINADYAAALNSRGNLLCELNRFEEGVSSYEQAIGIRPDHADTHMNLSVSLLRQGHLARGWAEHEWRWQTPQYQKVRIGTRAPLWDGRRLQGSLLVWNEQGIGDEIFFAGMLNDLQKKVDSITLCTDYRLVSLFQRSFTKMNFMARQALAPGTRFDAHIPLGSLGQYLRTDFRKVADTVKPYLVASRERANGLRAKIRGQENLLCGLSWISKSAATGTDKSLRLQDLTPLLRLPGFDFVNLQYGDTTEEQTALRAATGLQLQCVSEIDNFKDIDGLATLIEACDVVVTVSNSTAHLAAALGKPVLIMLPFAKGSLWYWHSDRADTPWYPSARLFRQPEWGDWKSVIDSVGAELIKSSRIRSRG